MKTSSEKDFKVIIVGGGIAGLTLANSLERAGINYVLLERRGDIAPQVGASIGFLPNGCRIMDQLGVYDEIRSNTVKPKGDLIWVDNGRKILESHAGDLLESRLGYQGLFLERQIVLRILHGRLEDKSKIELNSRVIAVDYSEKGVVVHCDDGKVYPGDIVVAADGVNSFVRSEMRRYADAKTKSLMEKDSKSLSAEYTCLFGISTPVPGIEAGYLHRAYNKGFSLMTIGGKDDRCYFFVFKKMDKKYVAPHIPHYTKAEEESHAQFFMNCIVGGTEGKTKFSDVWSRRVSSKLVATEEAQNENWCWGRFACCGDSIHKVTPNAGAGGNGAIESAAALANSLFHLVNENTAEKNGKPDFDAVTKALSVYHNSRKERMKKLVEDANNFTRHEAFASWKHRLLTLYFLPYAKDFIADSWTNSIVGAIKLDFLPRPKRTLGINMPFNPEHGIGKIQSIWRRMFFAIPLLVLYYYGSKLMGMTGELNMPFLKSAVESSWIRDPPGAVPIRSVYTGFAGLDSFVKLFVGAFTPSMAGLDHKVSNSGQTGSLLAPQRLQMLSFMADLTPINAIWMIESCRRGNVMTFVTLPFIFTLYAQLVGIGIVAPIYYFLHYISLPPSKYHAADNRLVRTSYAKTLIPALLIGYVLPTVAMYSPYLELNTRQLVNFIWQFFPIWTTLLNGLFSRMVKDTTEEDKVHNVTSDLPYLRLIYAFAALVSASAYLYVYSVSPLSLSETLLGGIWDPAKKPESLTEGMSRFLKYDWLFASLSGGLWTLLHFWDLKKDGRLQAGWFKILAVMAATTVLAGPGTALVMMWAWREEILATKEVQEA